MGYGEYFGERAMSGVLTDEVALESTEPEG